MRFQHPPATTKTFARLRLLASAAVALRHSGHAADVAPTAQQRAAYYQQEAREVLARHGWHINRDQAGKLTADCALGPEGAQFPGARSDPAVFGWLTVTFRSDSVAHTVCAANIVAYIYVKRPSDIKKQLSKPIPYNNEHMTKEIRDGMAEAEKRLVEKHSEYTARQLGIHAGCLVKPMEVRLTYCAVRWSLL